MTTRVRLSILGALFVTTGATALIVEQVFEKLLTTVVGSATSAGAIVLGAYFAGLSLGGVGYDRLRARVGNAWTLYATLEGVVGLCALGLGLLSSPIQRVSAQLVHLGGDAPAAVFLLRLVVASLWILPPTLAMGATYAAVVGALRTTGAPNVPVAMARLYAANLAGAVLGTVAAPQLLFPALGLTGTLLGVGAVQGMVVITALLLGRGLRGAVDEGSPPGRARARALALVLGSGEGRLLAAIAALSGFVVFACEVLWIHLIGVTLGMSVYAFALMLTAVLLGLFVGGLLVSLVAARRPGAGDWLLPAALGLGAVGLTVTCGRWDEVPDWLLYWRTVSTFGQGERLRFEVALLMVGVPSVALGMVYPSLFRLSCFPLARADGAAGVLGAANALGSISGALVTAFWLLPNHGSATPYRVIAVLPALAAVALLGQLLARSGRRRATGLALGAAIAITAGCGHHLWRVRWNELSLTSGAHVYFRRVFVRPSSTLEFWHEDTAGGITTVVANRHGARTIKTLLTNGKFQGDDGGEVPAQIALALLPCLATEGRERARVIGRGTGHSAAVVHAAGFREVDVAEIAPGIVAAARAEFSELNRDLLDAPNVRLFLEDGRNHLLRTRARYDVVSIEMSSIWSSGSANLFSYEFYELVRARLRPGGVLQQWIQLHHIAPEEVVSVLRTAREVFPHVSLWEIGRQGIVLASEGPQSITPGAIARLRAAPALARDLGLMEERDGFTIEQIESRLVLSPSDLDRVREIARARRLPVSTDGNRYLEFATPRHNLESGRTVEATTSALLGLLPSPLGEERARRLGSGRR